ncbi:MAG: I78 family peptidase inhibitor [Pseudomonadota bacterium]
MFTRTAPLFALLLTATVLSGCSSDAYPIRTGNDYAVTTGGLGSMAGGTVGTAPEQQRNWDQAPAQPHPGPDVMPPVAQPSMSVPSAYTPPPAADMPAVPAESVQPAPMTPPMAQTAPTPTYSNQDQADAAPACDYNAMVGKPLTEENVTRLVRLGKIVRELTPGQPATMDFQPNRINITTDVNTGKVTSVTCG